MEQEPNIQIPWESIEDLLKTHDWNSLNPEQRETILPFFNEIEYAQARQLLIQSEALFSEERSIQVAKKPFLRRLPYGIAAAAALALLISLGYLTLPNQPQQLAYSKSEDRTQLESSTNTASNENSHSEQIKPGIHIPVQEESAPQLGESNLKSKREVVVVSNSELEEIQEAEMDALPSSAGIAHDQGIPEPTQTESISSRKSRRAEESSPALPKGIPMVRDSIWKNDTLWLLTKTPAGKDSLLPAFNSKGKVWTRR